MTANDSTPHDLPPPADPARPTSEGYMTSEQAAAYLKVSARSLEAFRRRGGGPPYYKVGRLVRYAPSELREWMEQQRIASTSQKPGHTYAPATLPWEFETTNGRKRR